MTEKLKSEFEEKYYTEISTTKGIEVLAQNIGISKNSLRRFLGKLYSENSLSISILNRISSYMGYNDFQDFTKQTSENRSDLDFDILEIFYESVKGKGVVMGENRFQDVNYEFAKKIITNQNNLQKFITKFSNNYEALEYVLAWHPTYGRIARKEYQQSLLNFSLICDKSHLKVFSQSFVLFGKFVSMNYSDEKQIETELKIIEKNIKKMRIEYPFFCDFPEVRFAIAKTLFYYQNNYDLLLNSEIKNQTIYNDKFNTLNNRVIHQLYYADCLNLIGKYEDAESTQSQFSKSDLEHFAHSNYHHQTQMILFKVSRGISLFKTGNVKESREIFDDLSKLNHEKLPFDTKDYFELQYYLLGKFLFPDNDSFHQKLNHKIEETGFEYFRKID